MKRQIKNEIGSITLFVLVSMLFLTMFLATIYTLSTNNEIAARKATRQIKEIYEVGLDDIDNVYDKVKKQVPKISLVFEFDETNKVAKVINSDTYVDTLTGNIEIPSEVEEDGLVYTVTGIGAEAFKMCSNITGMTIPNSITKIENGAFQSCTKLEKIVIPDSVTNIGTWVFASCSNLSDVTMSENIDGINDGMFEDCTRLETFEVKGSRIGEDAFAGCSNLKNIIIPNTVSEIGNKAFNSCSNCDLTEIVLPNSVENIGDEAFQSCSGLTEIVLPDSVTNVGSFAFESCSSLKDVTISQNIKYISVGMFKGCTSLKAISIPQSATSLGISAFEGCTGLTEIVMQDDSITSIENSAFKGCTSLEAISIPNSVTSIGEYSFANCRNDENAPPLKLTISDNHEVLQINDTAFDGCENIEIHASEYTLAYYYANLKNITFVSEGNYLDNINLTGKEVEINHVTYSCSDTEGAWITSTNQGMNEIIAQETIRCEEKDYEVKGIQGSFEYIWRDEVYDVLIEDRNVSWIELSNTVRYIGELEYLYNAGSIIIPSNVTMIHSNAFASQYSESREAENQWDIYGEEYTTAYYFQKWLDNENGGKSNGTRITFSQISE